jgi:hypothetical protein
MRLFFALLLMMFFQTAYGQDSLTSYRTAIGINIAPLYARLLGGQLKNEKYEITLRQNINSKYSFRTKLSVFKYPFRNIYTNYYHPFKSTIIKQTDSTATTEDKFLEKSSEWDLYLSVERTLKIKKAYFILGLGIIPGVVRNRTLTYFANYKFGMITDAGFQGENQYSVLKIGATPYIGFIIPLTTRFYLFTQTNFEWNFYFNELKPFDGTAEIKDHYSYFSTRPIISEISLMYRFRKK